MFQLRIRLAKFRIFERMYAHFYKEFRSRSTITYMYMHSFIYAETRPPVIWMGKNHCGQVEIWIDGYKINEQKKFSKT